MADEVAELELFVEIVRAGNLSAAARALNSSPDAHGPIGFAGLRSSDEEETAGPSTALRSGRDDNSFAGSSISC